AVCAAPRCTTRAARPGAPARSPVACLGEIPDGGRKLVEVEGRSIGVFNVGGRHYAVLNRCPHQAGPLCLGPTTGLVRSNGPGDYTFERGGEILRCPWHGWEIGLATGRSVFDPERMRVKAYPIEVEALQAETYPVEVESNALIVIVCTP